MYIKTQFTRLESGDCEVIITCQTGGDFNHENVFPSAAYFDVCEWDSLDGGFHTVITTFPTRVECEEYASKVAYHARQLYAEWKGVWVPEDYGIVID